MKKLIAISLIVCVTSVLGFSAMRWDYNTSGENKALDTDGNTLLNLKDDGTTGEIEVYELDIGSGGVATDGTITLGSSETVAYDSTGAEIDVSTDIHTAGYIIAGSSNIATVPFSYSLDDTKEYSFSEADGKAGWFTVTLGTFSVTGSFTSAAVVTVPANWAGTTSDDTDNKVNVFDGGTVVTIENQTGGPETAWGQYSFVK